jgi:quinol monooxygenase YgiN
MSMEPSQDAPPSATPVIITWTFDLDPSQFDEFVNRTKQALAQLPKLSGWLGADLFANDDKSRVLIVSKWESRDAWGAGQWSEQVGQLLGDLFSHSRRQEFQLYLHVES